MDKPQYYALTLDDYATVSFCSFSKFYYGTLDDIIPFMEIMEKENEKPDMIAAFKDFILGNKEVTHAVAYNQQKLLTPVVFHQGVKQTYTDKSWTHKNIYGWPYEMHADRIEVEQAIITHEGKYHRFVPEKTGYYDIYSDSGDVIPVIWLSDADDNLIDKDNTSGEYSEFSLHCWLRKGETYYIETTLYDRDPYVSSTGSYWVYVEYSE